ncbi:hypothetical protein CAPTEDRAFT_146302, partial [Capitella teleta]
VTEDMIRKRSEHNEGIISTLEELSLHQQDIERIEWLDKWCRDLKILYLQSNLIPKIENISRLKKLEYLNLALNNIEKIENLQGCESLKKLDLTVNFVIQLTDIESLRELYNLEQLFLTGNPCTQYEGYKDYVIATLPQLKKLDGIDIERSERIIALQQLAEIRGDILRQQKIQQFKREREREEELAKLEGKSKQTKGSDWYTHAEKGVVITELGSDEEDEKIGQEGNKDDDEEEDKKFWEEATAYTPESRIAVHEHMKKTRERDEKKDEKPAKEPRKLFNEQGDALNVNQAKVDFSFIEDVENQSWLLDVAIFRHMDTSLCDVDVQTRYVRVTIKGKILQLALPEEVCPDSSSAKRSQTTGHLLISMPKAHPVIMPKNKTPMSGKPEPTDKAEKSSSRIQKLEVDPSLQKCVQLDNIVREKSCKAPLGTTIHSKIEERANSENFVDDPDVPPLM